MPVKKSSKSKSEVVETRTRSWTFVLYPESAPSDWIDQIDSLHIPWFNSPLHDKDINADGTPKKPHYHIGLSFDTVKSYDQVKQLTDSLHCPIPERCHSERGLVRYCAHLDNPEKAQYDPASIVGHQGFDVDEFLRPSATLRVAMFRDILSFARSHHIYYYCDIVDYAMENRPEWFDLLTNAGAIFLSHYFRSSRDRAMSSEFAPIDLDKFTGEIRDKRCFDEASN